MIRFLAAVVFLPFFETVCAQPVIPEIDSVDAALSRVETAIKENWKTAPKPGLEARWELRAKEQLRFADYFRRADQIQSELDRIEGAYPDRAADAARLRRSLAEDRYYAGKTVVRFRLWADEGRRLAEVEKDLKALERFAKEAGIDPSLIWDDFSYEVNRARLREKLLETAATNDQKVKSGLLKSARELLARIGADSGEASAAIALPAPSTVGLNRMTVKGALRALRVIGTAASMAPYFDNEASAYEDVCRTGWASGVSDACLLYIGQVLATSQRPGLSDLNVANAGPGDFRRPNIP